MKIGKKSGPSLCSKGCRRSRLDAIYEQVDLKAPCEAAHVCVFLNEIKSALEENVVPIIRFFKSDVQFIKENTPIRIYWRIENAEEVFIEDIGIVEVEGEMELEPLEPFSLELVAKNGIFEKKEIIKFEPVLPRILSFDSDKDIVPLGGVTTIRWYAEGYRKIFINDEIEVTDLNQLDVTINDNSGKLILETIGDFGLVEKKQISLKVGAITEFEFIKEHQEKKIFWSTQNIEQIRLIDHYEREIFFDNNNLQNRGSYTIDNSDYDITYKLIGYTKHGDHVTKKLALKATKVNVFEVDEKLVYPGMEVTIRWDVSDATKVVINHGIGEVEANGSRVILITKDIKEFTITAVGDLNETYEIAYLQQINISAFSKINLDLPQVSLPKSPRIFLNRRTSYNIGESAMSNYYSIDKKNFSKENPRIPGRLKGNNLDLANSQITQNGKGFLNTDSIFDLLNSKCKELTSL